MAEEPSAATPLAVALTVIPVSEPASTLTWQTKTSPATTVTEVVMGPLEANLVQPVPEGKSARTAAGMTNSPYRMSKRSPWHWVIVHAPDVPVFTDKPMNVLAVVESKPEEVATPPMV